MDFAKKGSSTHKSCIAIVLAVGLGTGWAVAPLNAAKARETHRKTMPEPKAVESVVTSNPLLPQAIEVERLWPDNAVNPKLPMVGPAGLMPLYTAEDWAGYRREFGAELDKLSGKKSSDQLAFCQKLLVLAQQSDTSPGLRRLLLTRTQAIAYRHKNGTPVADVAIAEFQKEMDYTQITQAAALWSMADSMTRYATTPKADRLRYDALAIRANIQLTSLLLDANQVSAAHTVVKGLTRHEHVAKNDPKLRIQINTIRALTKQTMEMMEQLGNHVTALNKGDYSAVVPLYMYARFVRPNPNLLNEVLARKGGSPVGHIHELLTQAQGDPMACYHAAEALKVSIEGYPEGILRNRTLYAAWQLYHAFLTNPATEKERVKRTLAGMAKQTLLAEGAKPNPKLDPFEREAAATQAATQGSVER